MDRPNIGGQAVIEGVMMRGPSALATAVRQPDGEIVVDRRPFVTIGDRYPLLKRPLLRGCVALVESLIYGMQALSWSAQAAGEEDEQLTAREMAMTMGFSVILAIALFIVLPTYATRFLSGIFTTPFGLNMGEGVLRLLIFFAYVAGISMLKDIRRVFQYHGAEHKTIFAYEAGLELNTANIRPFSTLHPRCGTNFLLIVMVVSIFMFAFLGWPSLWLRIVSRIVLMPVVAGVSYEIIRYIGKNCQKPGVRLLAWPGLMLQKLTTREPSDEQIEVAIKALQAVLPQQSAPDTAEQTT